MKERTSITIEDGNDWMEWNLDDEAEFIEVDISEFAAGYAATKLCRVSAEKLRDFLTAAIAEMKEEKS